MRKIVSLGLILFCASRLHAASAPPTQDVGAVNLSTCVTIVVSTTPTILLSTGSNNPDITGWIPGASTTSIKGQYMGGRIYLEIRNDSQNSIWIGPSASVSSIPWIAGQTNGNPNYGIQIPTVTARIDNDNWSNWYVVAGTTTFPVTVIQKR